MRLTDFGLTFAMILVCLLVVSDSKTRGLATIQKIQIQYNTSVDNAVQDALFHMVEVDSGRKIIFNKKEVIKKFFNSLWINMGIMEQMEWKQYLSLFIPVIALVEESSFTIFYHEFSKQNTMLSVYKQQEYFYKWKEKEYTLLFTLGDYITVIDENGEALEGNYHDIKQVCPLKIFENEQHFEQVRRNTIIRILEEKLTYYFNQHNKISEKYGILYEFSLPVIQDEEWYRTIDDISLLAFFQGYPYGNGITGYYNRVAIGGARIYKKETAVQ